MTEDIARRTIGDYLDVLASAAPTPGGGSAVAVAGALATALAEMVCNLTIGRPADAAAEPALRDARYQAEALRDRFIRLAADDEAAYAAYAAAVSLPRATEEEKAARRGAMQAALRTAADVPCAVSEACLALLTALEPIARHGNRHVLSDAEVSALLAEAALRGALANIRVNARLMTDRDLAQDYLGRASSLETAGRSAASDVIAAVQAVSPRGS